MFSSSFLPTAPARESHLNPEITTDTQEISNPAVTDDLVNLSEDPITSHSSSEENTTGKGRRLSGPRVRGRGLKKRKVSVPDNMVLIEETLGQMRGKMEEHCEDQTTANHEASGETSLTHTTPAEGEVDTELHAVTSANAHSSDSETKLECHVSLNAPASRCRPSDEESKNTVSLPSEPAQRKAKRGRKSSVNSSVPQEQENQVEEHQSSLAVTVTEQEVQAVSQQEDIRSCCDRQGDGGTADVDLAPWQDDFNFEDVFKPVATRGQRSVRRSLRNQSMAEHSSNNAGLAWLSWTSPDSRKESRRKTRGQRLSAALPLQPSLTEETQEKAS